jgi:hypothetical protein
MPAPHQLCHLFWDAHGPGLRWPRLPTPLSDMSDRERERLAGALRRAVLDDLPLGTVRRLT